MSDLAAHATEYDIVEGEPPELLGRNLSTAGHLLASATAFFFLAFVFAYFYLRSLNNAGLWLPKHVTPSIALGSLVMALSVLSAILVRLGVADQRAARRSEWRLKAAVALAVGVGAVVVQVIEWATADFGPADGGYASVFFGWTAFNVLFVAGHALLAPESARDGDPLSEGARRRASGRGRGVRRPGAPGPRCRRSAVARAAGSRGAVVLLDVPRRARCARLDRPLSHLGRAVPSFWSSAAWPVEPPLVAVVVVGSLYWLGGRRRVSLRRGIDRRAKSVAFYLGLFTIVVALDSPLDPLADTLFTAHMAQHVLLLTVAPALIVLAAPWTQIWQPLPLGFRRTVAKAVVVHPRARPLRAAAHATRPPARRRGCCST